MPVYYNGRLTTEETAVTFRYGTGGGFADANHVVGLVVPVALTAGTFRLRINGWETTPILVTSITIAADVEAALEAIVDIDGVAVFAAADVTVAGADPNYTITFAAAWANTPIIAEAFWLAGDTAIVGGTIADVTTLPNVQGGGIVTLSGHILNINSGETQETVDVTAMGETDRNESTTVGAGTWDMRLFHAQQNFLALLRKGSTGLLSVYEAGIGVGRPYFQRQILIKQSDVSREAFDKIEVSLSGGFQGAPTVPFGSNQPSS